MYSDYTVTASYHYSSGSSKNNPAFVMRKHGNLDEEQKNRIANLTDDEIVLASIDYAENRTKKTVAGKLVNALPSLFVTGVPLVLGAMSKGSLSSKVKAAFSTALIFGGILTVFKAYDNGMDRIENASKKIEEKRKEHPVAAGVFDFAAKTALVFAAGAAVMKGGKFLQDKFRPSADRIAKSVEKASKKLDNSALGRGIEKLNNKTDAFLDKHPKLAGFISKNSFLAPVLTTLGWVGFETAVQYNALNKECGYASQMADELILQREIARLETSK